MQRVSPDDPPLRTRDEVRAAVDASFADAGWEQLLEVWLRLPPPARVEWVLGELLVSARPPQRSLSVRLLQGERAL